MIVRIQGAEGKRIGEGAGGRRERMSSTLVKKYETRIRNGSSDCSNFFSF